MTDEIFKMISEKINDMTCAEYDELYEKSLEMKKNFNQIFENPISISIDNDNLEWLSKSNKDVQTQLNYVVRWAREHNCPVSTVAL